MNKDFDYLTQEETKRLFAVITDKRDRAIFLTAYRYGLRASRGKSLRNQLLSAR